MTIDEAIKHAREVAKNKREYYEKGCTTRIRYRCEDCFHNPKCKECADEHEQLAEWLELLKWYQQGMEHIPTESGVLPKDVYWAGYFKAIEEFVNTLIPKLTDAIYQKDVESMTNLISDVARELKAGGENE